MTQSENHSHTNLRRLNGWMKVQLLINAIFLFALYVAFRRELGDARYVLMAIGSLAFAGAFFVNLGLTRLGAILFLLGSTVFIPLGGIGIVGALRRLNDLDNVRRHAVVPLNFDESPAFVANALNGDRIIVIGGAMSVVGVLAMAFVGVKGAIFVAVGLLTIAFAVGIKNEPPAALYERFGRFRRSMSSWVYVPYDQILDISKPEGGPVTIRYRDHQEEKAHVLDSKLFGEAQLATLVQELKRRAPQAT